jgi:restriction system protein
MSQSQTSRYTVSEPNPQVECPGPRCALQLLQWLRGQGGSAPAETAAGLRQATLWADIPYSEESIAIRSPAELDAAWEHLEYVVFRRFHNELTRGERSRLENSIRNALFKIDRYAERLVEGPARSTVEARAESVRTLIRDRREALERQRRRARRAELKLAQLANLTPDGFEEFVAELLEVLGWQVARRGGAGDQGVDLAASREGLKAIVQCKYHGKSLVGSPEAQMLLGAVHRTGSHKGLLVTTGGFTLSAERFAADQPLELIDGPRLVELVREALGDRAGDDGPEPFWSEPEHP